MTSTVLDDPLSPLQQEYEYWQRALAAQPPLTQRGLEAQARLIADAILQKAAQVKFVLPDQVTDVNQQTVAVPAGLREHVLGGFFDRLSGADIGIVLRQRLTELSQTPHASVTLAAGLLRHAVVLYMINGLLPAGHQVNYLAVEGEEIPSLPDLTLPLTGSALTAASDAIAEADPANAEQDEVIVPYVPAARRFYLPQWVAFDENGQLIVKSASEAEAHVGSMQKFLAVLHAAVGFAPYIVADDDYQHKRYGMLGQLVNQGRALARFQTRAMLAEIHSRAQAHDLNRGLSLSLPYFDDQTLNLSTLSFEVIPAGRVMFVPAFVARAAREQHAKVAQDTRLSRSTRKHLLAELSALAEAFASA